jgi:hypothetical protein
VFDLVGIVGGLLSFLQDNRRIEQNQVVDSVKDGVLHRLVHRELAAAHEGSQPGNLVEEPSEQALRHSAHSKVWAQLEVPEGVGGAVCVIVLLVPHDLLGGRAEMLVQLDDVVGGHFFS